MVHINLIADRRGWLERLKDKVDKWQDEWARNLTPAERDNLRSWGIDVPEPPKQPLRKAEEPFTEYVRDYGLACTEHSHTAVCTESTEPHGQCGHRARRG